MNQERQEKREHHELPEHVARICIVGKARSGKDTACEILKETFGFPYYMGSEPIKNYAYENNISINSRQDSWDLAHYLIDEYGKDFYTNDLMQNFGREYLNNHQIRGIVYAGSRLEQPILDLSQSSNFLLIEVSASDDIRFKRTQHSPRSGELTVKEQFVLHDKKEYEEIDNMLQTISETNFVHITNEGAIDDFRAELIQAVSNTLGIHPNTTHPTTPSS